MERVLLQFCCMVLSLTASALSRVATSSCSRISTANRIYIMSDLSCLWAAMRLTFWCTGIFRNQVSNFGVFFLFLLHAKWRVFAWFCCCSIAYWQCRIYPKCWLNKVIANSEINISLFSRNFYQKQVKNILYLEETAYNGIGRLLNAISLCCINGTTPNAFFVHTIFYFFKIASS